MDDEVEEVDVEIEREDEGDKDESDGCRLCKEEVAVIASIAKSGPRVRSRSTPRRKWPNLNAKCRGV